MNQPHYFLKIFKLAIVSLCVVLSFSGCTKKETEPIKIGFLGGMTGRFYRLGVDGRDGVLLAVERANARGGVNGRAIKLLIRDDRQNAKTAIKEVTSLNNENVVALVGPFTSSMAVVITPYVNRFELVTIGPTVSTTLLNNQDDYFLRNYPESEQQAKVLAEYITNTLKIKKLSVVYDLSNKEHCESWITSLTAYLEKSGGQVVNIKTFDSSENKSYLTLAKSVLTTPSEGVFILASSVDTGLICQQLEKLDFNKALLASEWSFTDELLQIGGLSVEGMTIVHTYNPRDHSPKFLKFTTEFTHRFGRKPSFASVHAFDATNLILAGLAEKSDQHKLRETILQFSEIEGVQTRFHLNRYGDAKRDLFLTTIKNGDFTLLN